MVKIKCVRYIVIYSDRMGLAKSVKTDVLLEYDTWGCHKFPVAVHVFQADLALVLANGKHKRKI